MFKATTRQPQAGPSSARATPEVKLNRRLSNGGPSSRYPYRLNFYRTAPAMDITLDEFEIYAIARLKGKFQPAHSPHPSSPDQLPSTPLIHPTGYFVVLCSIHALLDRSLPLAQFKELAQTSIKTNLPLSSNTARNAKLDEERRRDEIGHWVLTLAFSRSPDLREKFIKAESELFRLRFETDDIHERDEFVRSLKFGWTSVDDAEKRGLRGKLASVMSKGGSDEAVMAESYVKVPWYVVPDLVASRKVYITGGYAYVPQALQISLVLQAFRERLSKALEHTARSLPRMDEDDRLLPILSHLALSFLTNIAGTENTFFGAADSDGNSEKVTAEMVDGLAVKHFPACQLNLWRRLKRDRHLKHYGRLQFGLFLKALGLPLEEAVVYWRRAYGTTMSDDKFNKEYRYNIRHSYGQEGKRSNYPAKNCQQILTGVSPGAQDAHGCPYRHFSPDHLQTFLVESYPSALQMGSIEMREVMDSVKKTHYHVACTRVFELTHRGDVGKGEGLGGGDMVTHPNEYYNRSLGYEKAKKQDTKPATPETSADAMQLD